MTSVNYVSEFICVSLCGAINVHDSSLYVQRIYITDYGCGM